MADTAQAAEMKLTFEGKEYTVLPFTEEMIPLVEAWAEARAWKRIEEKRKYLSPESYEKVLATMLARTLADDFKVGSATMTGIMSSVEGQKYLTLLQLRAKHPEADEALVERMFVEAMEMVAAHLKAAEAAVKGAQSTVKADDGAA